MSHHGSNNTPELRRTSSAGGSRAADENGTTLSCNETSHDLPVENRATIAIRMLPSQKTTWLLLSQDAWIKAVFPESFFADEMIIPDVSNSDIWSLLYETTRKTFIAESDGSIVVQWLHVFESDSSRMWNLYFTYPDGTTKLEYSLWPGNTLREAQAQLAERRKSLELEQAIDFEQADWITTPTNVKVAEVHHGFPTAYDSVTARKVAIQQITGPLAWTHPDTMGPQTACPSASLSDPGLKSSVPVEIENLASALDGADLQEKASNLPGDNDCDPGTETSDRVISSNDMEKALKAEVRAKREDAVKKWVMDAEAGEVAEQGPKQEGNGAPDQVGQNEQSKKASDGIDLDGYMVERSTWYE